MAEVPKRSKKMWSQDVQKRKKREQPGKGTRQASSCEKVLGRKPKLYSLMSGQAGCAVSIAGLPFFQLQVNEL